jgi:hypothetical protein
VRRGLACPLVLVAGVLYGCQNGPRPAHLAAVPASLDFGTVLIGTTASRAPGPSWKNDGEKSTRVSALELSGTEAASFGSDPRTLMSRVRPNEVTQAVRSVTFSPLKRGIQSADLTPLVSDGTADPVTLRGSGQYVFRDGDFAVLEPPAGIPDDAKPLNCGRVLYGASSTCSFDVRNDGNAAVNVTITLGPAGGAFAVASPASPVAVAAGAQRTITITFAPPNQPPLETLFAAGVVVSAGANASGRALCGVGFRNPVPTELPPAGTTVAALACP